jgi:uncharacterized protein YukJ
MPIQNYGVLKGRVFARQLATAKSEHYQMLVNRGNGPQRIAINTQSATAPSQLLYYANPNFQHPITAALLKAALPFSFQPLPSTPGGLALDFVREKLFDKSQMVVLPGVASGNHNDLNDQLDLIVQLAIQEADALLYAFGQHWKDASGADQYFPEINPSTGVHDIHMNQGNPKGSYYADNGVYQDGGLLFYFPSTGRWAGVFTAFQSESWVTDGKGIRSE